ncbi:Mfa1 family fimbria major subunit [Parabacteroides sp. PF5-6]|uniref:Mfa1 family fimbria major subunit n=1 Tax=Parabacteroides sp. PF5-6 TaxID=1742403 RepID=UPI002404E8A1|nr:Mfa1 family fimbria major subunit [Parabacteroides sp. PF5-6]MDF9830792.1 hypothetical protein [Parabacteroides sp. PF5-6]
MNIRNKIGLLALCVCLIGAFTACSDDDNDFSLYGNKKRGDVFLSLQMETDPSLSTRATGTDYGTKEEKAVVSVHALFYEAAGENSKLLYNFNIEAKTNGEENFNGNHVHSGNQSQFVSKAIDLKKQDYQLVVLVNASDALLSSIGKAEENFPSGYNTLKDLQTAIIGTSAETFYDTDKKSYFLMSNAGGIIYVPQSMLKNRDSEATAAPAYIPVERIVAKVSVHKGFAKDEVEFGGKIGNVSWDVDVTNKQTYLMRQADYLITGVQESGFHNPRNEVYAKDPNFDTNEIFLTDETKKKEHFTLLGLNQTDRYLDWNPTTATTTYYRYVLENTMAKADQNKDKTDPKTYTTQILLKVQITEPKGLKDIHSYYSFEDKTEPEGKQWKVFSHAQAVEWYNGTYPSDMAALKAVLESAQKMENSPFNFNKEGNAEPTEFVTTSLNKLTYHKDGLNVYRIPIMHFGVDDRIKAEEDYGYYGVVRNNIYKIVIKSIKGPGVDSSNEGYVSADITINPWYGREWEEDLKPGE